MPDTYKEGDVLQNDQGQKIVLRNNKWVPFDESAISRFGSGLKAGTKQLIPPNPFTVENLKNAAMGGPGMLYNLVNSALMEYSKARSENQPKLSAAAAIPGGAMGLDTEGIRQRAAQGDIAGIAGEAVPSIAATVLLPEIPKTGRAAAETSRGPVRSVLGVGKEFEARLAAEHQTALTDYNAKLSQIMSDNRRAVNEARQSHEQAVSNIEKQNAEARAEYQGKIDAIKKKYAGQVAEKQAAVPGASASQSASEAKRSAMGDSPRSGPVFQRLQGMTNQVYGMIDNLQDRIRTAYDKRWRAFDGAVDEAAKKKTGEAAQVDWTPVQQAVKDAETKILKGSPESISIFRNIMKESPQLDEASVFRTTQALEAAGNLKDILNNANPNMRRQILANLHAQGMSEADVARAYPPGQEPTGLPGKNVKIPFSDARGYYTELGSKISGAQLPGDVYQALKHVREVIDEQVTRVTKEHGQDAVYNNLKRDWRDYKQAFDEPDAAIYQFDKLDTPEKRIDFLASGKGQNLIDTLSKYKGFGAEPGLPGRVRSLVRQIRDLPTEKKMPSAPERPSFPKEPAPAEFPTEQKVSLQAPPTEPEPLDITRKRVEQLEHMAKTWSQFQPNQARWLRAAISQRTIGRLLSDPNFRAWVAREGR